MWFSRRNTLAYSFDLYGFDLQQQHNFAYIIFLELSFAFVMFTAKPHLLQARISAKLTKCLFESDAKISEQ